MHRIDQNEPSEEFQTAWKAARVHIQNQCVEGIYWIRARLEGPLIEHLSFRIGNQLFFVFVEAAEFSLSDFSSAFLDYSCHANAIPCVFSMTKRFGVYHPVKSGWGLVHARTKRQIDPIQLVSDELIEISDWELQDFSVNLVMSKLEAEGKFVYSTCSDPELHPSLWFVEAEKHYWVVVKGRRYPSSRVESKETLSKIAASIATTESSGYLAYVTVANSDDPFDYDAEQNGNFLPLYRGHGMVTKYNGLEPFPMRKNK